MKKIILALALIVVLSLFFLPLSTFADEITPTESEETPLDGVETPTDGETVTVDKELWDEITTLLDKIKAVENPEEIGGIVYDTIFTRLTAWFGDNAKTIVDVVTIIFVLVWTIINRKDKPKLYAGLNTSYKKIKEVAEQNDNLAGYVTEIKGKLNLSETQSKIAEISSNGALQIANLLVQNSNLTTAYKDLAQNIYNDCTTQIKAINEKTEEVKE